MLRCAQKATPSLVIAQCYQMGPSVKVDPLTMLGEAKRICDTLVISSFPVVVFTSMMYFCPACFTRSTNRTSSSRTIFVHPRIYCVGPSALPTVTSTHPAAINKWKTPIGDAIYLFRNIESTIVRRLHGTSAFNTTTICSRNVWCSRVPDHSILWI